MIIKLRARAGLLILLALLIYNGVDHVLVLQHRKLHLTRERDASHHVPVRNWMARIKEERDAITDSQALPTDVCKALLMFRPSAQCRDFDRVGDIVCLK